MGDKFRVIVAAAGTGSRMGAEINKQYMLLNSWPILKYSLDIFEGFNMVEEIIIVANPREIDYCKKEVVNKFGYKKISQIVAGGKERQDSVWAGLKKLDEETDCVAVHDGARPLLSRVLLDKLLRAAREWGAAVPGILARDTLKTVDNSSFVGKTLDRSNIVNIQTPQVFKHDKLLKAYECAYKEGFIGTDDASLFEKFIGRVKVVPGDYKNIKVTTPEDLIVAQSFLNGEKPEARR